MRKTTPYSVKVLSATILMLTLCSATLLAQKHNIQGKIVDAQSAEPLVGVPVTFSGGGLHSVATNTEGEFSISLINGRYTISVALFGYIGYEQKKMINKDERITIALKRSDLNLSEVVVTGVRDDANVSSPQTGVTSMNIELMNRFPVLLGERDIIKSIQLMPGVKSAGEGSSGFFVRGGTVDQNLTTLDDVTVYNASHLMGFFSTFNSDIIKSAELYKGTMPAEYGGRLASILEVAQRDGSRERFGVSGGIGLISSRLNIEAPIQKNRSSFVISARRTYADAVAKMVGVKQVKGNKLYFYDLNAKADVVLGLNDRLSFSAYIGRDVMEMRDIAGTEWGNMLGVLKWNHIINNKWSFKLSGAYNRYEYRFSFNAGSSVGGGADIEDLNGKLEFVYSHSEKNVWRFGVSTIYHTINPGKVKLGNESEQNSHDLLPKYSSESAVYVSNQWKISPKIELVYGVRLSGFLALGKGEQYWLNENYEIVDTTRYRRAEVAKSYFNLEPRLSGVYKFNAQNSIKAAYSRTTQNMHMLSLSSQGTPYDRWISSSNVVKPQVANLFSLGYFRNFHDNTYELGVEIYYKHMQNQIDFIDNANLTTNDVIETDIRRGRGRAYGIELLLRKNKGRFSGWVSYTLAKTEKRIEGINKNRWYDAYQDRTHDVSIVLMYQLTKRWDLSMSWVYYTGNAVTYPSGKYIIGGGNVVYYTERNGYRAPAYHRLDIGATYQIKKTARYESELAFSLYNAYGRKNAYMINFINDEEDINRTYAYKYTLFTFVPSISWNFKF